MICKEHSIDAVIFDDEDSIGNNLAAPNSERIPMYENSHHAINSFGGGWFIFLILPLFYLYIIQTNPML